MIQKWSKIIGIVLVCTALFALIPASELDGNSEPEDSIKRLKKDINQLLNTGALKHAAIGIQIVSLNSGEVVYAYQPNSALNPASNTKLITSAAALVKLKPEYTFKTSVYTNAKMQNGVLQGDLYVYGGGDPSLSYEGLLRLAQDVYNAGVRTITGNVIGDDSFFDTEREFSGWEDFKTAYSGKISALSLNHNVINVMIKPAAGVGKAPQVILDPPTTYFSIRNKAVTAASTKNRIHASLIRPDASGSEPSAQETLVVQGKISSKSKYGTPAAIYVYNPSLFATTVFRDALRQIGITIEGTPVLGKIPKKSWRLALYESAPLARIICESNKDSDNFVAEQMLKTLGAEHVGIPGTTAKGIQVIRDFLAELDIPPDTYILENGSGLSRNNRLSPQQIVTVLAYMHDNFEVRAEYLASLAIAGVDGTLQRRLRDTQAERRLRAKTGAIAQVSCLSGYAASKDNEIFAFSIMMNNYRSGGYTVKKIQNEIGLLLTEFYRPTYNARSETTQKHSAN